ncbi:hypothetical protein PX701_05340 [Agromyces sp. H3Y2-19a]|jgi:hypothetical protein|uniref:hypothetical protein n=1 Tax=Agromyces TaxID=33877 RepID=UPI001E290FC9|nr:MULTISPECIES: hypothetical protein [Agromyces]MCD5346681.1 hypothetical protein [Agromyces sp. S2-1-8]MDF0513041.1 hypothetical protein [Agromyces chromiiresistens]
MELLFVTLGGAIIGIAAHFLFPLRKLRGVALVPAIGAGVAAVVWVALTWLGWPWDGGWIWVVSLAASAIASAASAWLIGPGRQKADDARFEHLSRHGLGKA